MSFAHLFYKIVFQIANYIFYVNAKMLLPLHKDNENFNLILTQQAPTLTSNFK